jgi:hypothetical protein
VLPLRRLGAARSQIGRAAGSSRQAAHERWGQQVPAVLDRYGEGQLGGPLADDEAAGSQHLFADSSPSCYDAPAAALLTARLVEFLAAIN